MSKKLKYVLTILIFGILAAFAVWKYTFRKSGVSVESWKTDVIIEAPQLLHAFEINEDSANTLYLDKILQVSGTVESVREDSLGYAVYLKEPGALSGVICSMGRTAFDPALIKVGSRASLKGVCAGYLMDVIVNKCSVAR